MQGGIGRAYATASRPVRAPSPRTVLELLKPITWFAPMWAFGCGVVSAGGPSWSDFEPVTDVAHSTCRSVAFSADLLATGHDDGAVRLWDHASGTLLRVLSGHVAGVLCVAFSPDGATLASGSHDMSVRLWDPASGRQLRCLRRSSGSIHSVAVSPDGRIVAAGLEDKSIRLWDRASGKSLRKPKICAQPKMEFSGERSS